MCIRDRSNTKRSEEEGEAIGCLQSAVRTASNYLRQCGNEVIIPDSEDEFTVDILYNLLCRNESAVKPLSERVQEVIAKYMENGRESDVAVSYTHLDVYKRQLQRFGFSV